MFNFKDQGKKKKKDFQCEIVHAAKGTKLLLDGTGIRRAHPDSSMKQRCSVDGTGIPRHAQGKLAHPDSSMKQSCSEDGTEILSSDDVKL